MEENKFKNIDIYDDVSFDDLLKEIHFNAKDTHNEIKDLISQLSDQITNPSSAQIIVPLIAEFLNINVRNQSQLLKMADVIQKHVKSTMKNSTDDGKLGFSENDMKSLMESLDDIDAEDAEFSEVNEKE